MGRLEIVCKHSLRIPIIVLLLPFYKRIDISRSSISIDGKPLRGDVSKKLSKLSVRRYGISRFGLYKKLRRCRKSLYEMRKKAIRMVANKKLIKILLDIRRGGKIRRFLKDLLKELEARDILGKAKEKISDLIGFLKSLIFKPPERICIEKS